MRAGAQCESLEDYLTAFDVTLSVLQTEDALRRAAHELALDCAAENVRYLEVRYSPVLHTRKALKPTAIVDAVLDGLRAAGRETGIRSNVIICGIRHIDPQTSVRLAELAVAYKGKESSASISPARRRDTRRGAIRRRCSSSWTTT